MMRIASVVLALIVFSVSARAQAVEVRPYWIFLGDAYLMEDADAVSQRAIERRTIRGDATIPTARIPLASVLTDIGSGNLRIRTVSRLLGAISVDATADDVAWLASRPYVLRLRPVRQMRLSPDPDHRMIPDDRPVQARKGASPDPGLAREHLEMINALEPISRGIDGRGVILGFLDTEYGDFEHAAFSHHRAEGRIGEIRNVVGIAQTNRHGQMVASVASGREDGYILGPAHGATLYGAVTEYVPTETPQEEDFFVEGLEWLEALGADVVNVSLGYTTFDDPADDYRYEDLDGETAVTTIAVQRAVDLGVTVVVSAGNEAACGSPEQCWYYIGTPADARGAITVGAVMLDGTRVPFSSLGPTADGRTKPDVSAPGVSNLVAVGTDAYARAAGTSFSAPLVSGVVCQMLQVNDRLTPAEVLDILRETASQSTMPDNELGWGIIDATAAVREAERRRERPLPDRVQLVTPHPNPFRDRVYFEMDVPASGFAGRLTLYDSSGRAVAWPFDGTLSPGFHSLMLESGRLASGVYFFHLFGPDTSETGTVVLIR